MNFKKLYTRRKFLKIGAAVSVSSFALGCAASSAKPKKNLITRITEYLSPNEAPLKTVDPESAETVLIIGAGIAGLAAANELLAHGFKPIVIEANSTIGGRIHTDRSLGSPVELGAMYIFGAENNPMVKLAEELSLPPMSVDYDNSYLYGSDGLLLPDVEQERIFREVEKINDSIETMIDGIDDDASVAQLLAQITTGSNESAFDGQVKNYFAAKAKISSGAELNKLSVFYHNDDYDFDGPPLYMPTGFDGIIEQLSKGLDIRRSEVARKIAIEKNKCALYTDKKKYKADRVIVTASLGVLKNNSINFQPGLPKKKLDAIKNLEMGCENRIALKFPSAFWPTDREFIELISAEKSGVDTFLNLSHIANQSVLVGTVAANQAQKLERKSNSAIGKLIHNDLKAIFGNNIPQPERVISSRWTSEPHIHGAFSFVPLGGTSDEYEVLAESVADRIFFAGEATSVAYRATVHGAYLSGIREARKIIDLA